MNRQVQVAIKYGLDRLLGLVCLVLLTPVMLLIAAIIRLADGGPALFVHRRVGADMRTIDIYKFRTMIVNADSYLDHSGRPTRERVTRVGRVLRKTSLDELPQLLNIAKGEMSFIGPRPMLRDHLARLRSEDLIRFRMRPGMSGLAQVHGRTRLPWSERLRLDSHYVREFSLKLDLSIARRTFIIVLRPALVAEDRNPDDVMDLPISE